LHRISAASILASAADKSMHFDWTGFKRISTDHHLAAQQIGRFTAEIRKIAGHHLTKDGRCHDILYKEEEDHTEISIFVFGVHCKWAGS
jgi:hypothetical protein